MNIRPESYLIKRRKCDSSSVMNKKPISFGLYSFPGGSDSKGSTCNTGDLYLILKSRRYPAEEKGNLFQYSWLKNAINRGTWWATVPGVINRHGFHFCMSMNITWPLELEYTHCMLKHMFDWQMYCF